MHAAITHCLQAATAVPATDTLAQWLPGWRQRVATGADPMTLALHGGFAADRMAWAFAAGYQAALRALLPGSGPDEVMALCLTESTGNRPRDLRCLATEQPDGGWLLQGEKSWSTFGTAATTLLVVAVQGGEGAEPGSHPRLLALRVPPGTPGVAVHGQAPTSLVPELPHAKLALNGALLPAEARLPGDGFSDYGKPFRTLEDQYVSAAILAWLLREARARGWPEGLRERLAATLAVLAAVADSPPDAATTHVALAGALAWARELHAEVQPLWAATPDDPASQRWLRDAKLLGVAGAARAARAARAWERLVGEQTGASLR